MPVGIEQVRQQLDGVIEFALVRPRHGAPVVDGGLQGGLLTGHQVEQAMRLGQSFRRGAFQKERAGAFDRTAFFLTADHGMEEADPEVTGDWNDALGDLDLDYRDEGFGFIYVNP